ncbi:MAG: hypothetical protein U0325_22865 [Polyangiales bacterium]
MAGCAGAGSPVAGLPDALRLELNPAWRLADEPTGAVQVRVTLAGCAADTWTLTLHDRDGATTLGPVALHVGGFPAAARTRIAALWIAEWLATLPPPSSPLPPPSPAPPAAVVLPAPPAPVAPRPWTPPSAPPPVVRAASSTTVRARFGVTASFRQVPETPASLGGIDVSLHLLWGRFGVELGGGLEAGLRWSAPLAVARGSVAAFWVFTPAARFSVDVGVRLTLADLLFYDPVWGTRQSGRSTVHGGGGVFGRALLRVSARTSLAMDLEAGGNPWYAEHSLLAGDPRVPVDHERILGGFFFVARTGVLFD